MQKPNEKKRQAIVRAAAKLFAAQPFHEVKLDDVAARAAVGKGTLYIYFKSKEDLYLSLVEEGFGQVVSGLEECLREGDRPTHETLEAILAALVDFAGRHPDLFEMMRSAGAAAAVSRMQTQRRSLTALIENEIRRGVRRGELRDPHPEITALCIPGLVRSVFLFGPKGQKPETVTRKLVRLLLEGITAKPRKP